MTSPNGLADEARALVERLGGRWSGGSGLCRCPAHADRTPSLSIRPGRSRLLFHCFAGCAPQAVIEALSGSGDLVRARPATAAVEAVPRSCPLQAAAFRLWRESRPIDRTAGERYLSLRGLSYRGTGLRFHSRTPFGRYPLTVLAPALIAAVHDEAGQVAVHRTRIDKRPDRCRIGTPVKAALGALGSGAVRLAPAGPRLGLAEGIEDALSVTALTGIPCWAALGSARFGRVALPSGTTELILFLDNDAGGRRAEQLAREAHGRTLRISARYPAIPGGDWSDVWMAGMPRRREDESKGGG